MAPDENRPIIDTSVAHPARRYNYWLGGKDNFKADRESADAIEAIYPYVRTTALQNRLFLQRVVRYLVKEAGVRQLLDIGTGLPTADNTHEVAQAIEPTTRIVYVDNDPLVLVHARALLVSDPRGRTAYLEADMREPERILADAELTSTLNLDEPVGLLLIAVLHFITDTEQAAGIVRTLMDGLAPGSYVALSHGTGDFLPRGTADALRMKNFDFTLRSRAQIEHLFDGYDVAPPGVEVISDWRNPGGEVPPADQVAGYGGLARKPAD
ncbi:SAM-dependent methyltransferase [Actinoplanes sp. NPDC051475]|uniref:SAM-dependent methyltransferase n=1 Tax=Actinoplanes sp. NPDC051475 TaxID=3157225 RepID=UPI00344F065D